MNLTDPQISNFVNRIKLGKKSRYIDQIDTLKSNVINAINGMDGTKVEKIIRAGSWKKGTALRPHGDNPLDIDMVVFVHVDAKTSFNSEELRQEIIDVLAQAYPQKSKEDFTNGKKTVGIVFKGTGLEVDIVPFIPDSNSKYGRQPRKKLNSGDFKTNVEEQLSYINKIKDKWPSFLPSVQLIKWWRNRKELELPSFAIELIFAHLVETGRISYNSRIESAIIEFFNFVSAHSKMRINFPNAIGVMSGESPYIADPTNNENNVLANLEKSEWDDIIAEALEGFEIISYASCIETGGITGTVDKWREVFESFTIQNQEG